MVRFAETLYVLRRRWPPADLLAPLSVAIVAGTVLPYLSARDHRLLAPEKKKLHDDEEDDSDDEDEDDKELSRIKEMVRQWKLDASREGRPLRLPTSE